MLEISIENIWLTVCGVSAMSKYNVIIVIMYYIHRQKMLLTNLGDDTIVAHLFMAISVTPMKLATAVV